MEGESSGKRQRGMTPLRAVLAAGVPRPWDISGDYFHVKTAPVDDLIVRFDDGEPVPLSAGMGMRRYYDRVTIESATGQTVVVFAGFGTMADARATANVNVTATVEAGNTINNGGDVNVTAGNTVQLLAADADRVYALLKNVSTNTLSVRIGSATVGAADGLPLEPGETLPYASTAAIYAHNANGSDVTINASSIKQV
jgi:hypothetical protein